MDAEALPEEAASQAAPPEEAVPPPAPPPPAGKADVLRRLSALAPGFKAAVVQKGPDLLRIQSLFTGLKGLVAKNDFGQAVGVLDELEPLIAGARPAAAAAPATPPPATGDAAAFTARLKALMPEVIKAQATKTAPSALLKPSINEAQACANNKDYLQANAALDRADNFVRQALAAGEAAAQWQARLAQVKPEVERCLQEQRGDTGKMQTVLAYAEGKAGGGDYPAALKGLQALEALLRQAAPAAEQAATDSAAGQWQARLQALTPLITRCLKEQLGDTNKIRAVFAFAQGKAAGQDYEAALKSLKPLEALIQQALAAAEQPSAGEVPLPILDFAKKQLDWKAAQQKVNSQVASLQKAIVAEIDDPDAAAVAGKLDAISKRLEGFTTGLVDALDDVLNAATAEDRSRTLKAADKATEDYLQYAQTSELLFHATVNPFDGAVVEAETILTKPLKALLAQIRAASA